MLVRIATLFACLSVILPARDFAGARACASCHAKQYAAHTRSAHARALAPADRHPLADQFRTSGPLQRGPAFSFAIANGTLHGSDGSNQIELPLSWAFGAGVQAVTFVARVNPEWYVEYFWSYYPKLRGFAATPGQQAIQPKTLQEAAGLLYKTDDAETGIRGCFECHSTGPVRAGADRALEPTELGVRCEACHGPGGAHAAAPSRVNIGNPGRLRAAQLNQACGRCHRPPPQPGVETDWNFAWNVRHQPIYLSQSACFRKSNGALTCLTCHDAHEPLDPSPAAYNQRCQNCHTRSKRAPKAICLAEQQANCVNCHMPLVSPQSPLRFANHWIGVYAGGSNLRPKR